MGGEVVDFGERRGRKYLEAIAMGSMVTLNLRGETRTAVYKGGPIKLVGSFCHSFKFAIEEGDGIKIAEVLGDNLEVIDNEIHLPPEFSDLGYEGWIDVDPDSHYWQNINRKFVRARR